MKKALLFSLVFFKTLSVFAYETIIFHFPDGELWEKGYYKKQRNEAILQYVPGGSTNQNWTRTIFVHSYNDSGYAVKDFARKEIQKMKRINPTENYKTLLLNENEALFTRCTEDYNNTKGQCEFLRISKPHGMIAVIQYINRNKNDFENNYTLWFQIIKEARFMNSYWRDERTFDKSLYFEL